MLKPLSDWAHLIAFPCASWIPNSVAEAAANDDHQNTGNFFGERIERLPEPGSLNVLMVDNHFGMPVSGGSIWVLFKPPYSSVNDWDLDVPEELLLSGLVRVEVVEILSKYVDNAWLRVRVLDVLTMTKIAEKWAPSDTPARLPDLLDCGQPKCQLLNDFAWCTASADDCFQAVLCHRRQSHWNLLMHFDWQYHSDFLEVGCRELSEEESKRLGLPASAN